MRLRLGILFLAGVMAACGGSVANDPTGGEGTSGTSSSGGTSSGSRGSSGSNGSRGADPGTSDPPSGNGAGCPPSTAPPNPPECPPTYRDACFSGDAGTPTGPITCWYPGQGDGRGNGCWSDALYQCREADDPDGGKTLRCACAQ